MTKTDVPVHLHRPNVFNLFTGSIRFILFWTLVILQLPIIVLLPRGRISVAYMRVFMWVLLRCSRIRTVVHGTLDSHRPLLVVANHISLFEIATFPVMFGGSFASKKEVKSWPIVGWVATKFGVIYVDRRPSHAIEALETVRRELATVKYPLYIFPEGTTTNGAYVKQFKSTLFNIAENSDLMIQPVVVHYRDRRGAPIADEDIANHLAYFTNAKQDMGPKCSRERSAFAQVFHVMAVGGFTVEVTVLPARMMKNMDRKQIANQLHEVMSDKYMELKYKGLKK